MRTRYKPYNKEGVYFVTSTVVEWHSFLNSDEIYQIILDEFKFRRENKSIKLYGYVLMPNHFHCIIYSENINKIMQMIKSYTARKIIDKFINEERNEELAILSTAKTKSG